MQKLLSFLLLLLPMLGSAAPVELVFDGTVNRMYTARCTNLVQGSCNAWSNQDVTSSAFFAGQPILVGDRFGGRTTYDTAARLSGISDDGAQAVYLNGVSSFVFAVGAVSLPTMQLPRSGTGDFSVVNDRYGWDSFYLSQWFSQGDWFASTSLNFFNYSGTLFSDLSQIPSYLPKEMINGTLFTVGFLQRSTGDQLQISGTVNDFSFSPMQVPEPTGLLLLATGLGALLWHRRYKGT